MNAIFDNTILLILSGLISIIIMVICADIAVAKLSGLAGYFRLSTTFVGVTVVSLATSIPEIVAHYTASFGILSGLLNYEVSSAIVLGANIGSNVVQQTLIMAIVIFIAGRLQFKRYFLWKSIAPMIATHVLCIILGYDGTFSRIDGAILFGSFIAYNAEDHGFNGEDEMPENVPHSAGQAWKDAGISMITIIITVLCSMVVLKVAEKIVSLTGLGGSMIGVITLGVASALPELTTAVSGIRKGDTGIPLGTLIGSNVTNPLVAIGGGALISKYWVPGPLIAWDLPWEILSGMLLWVILWKRGGNAGKKTAIYLTLMYVIYVSLRIIFFGSD
jgi:cation:H+ antiporter